MTWNVSTDPVDFDEAIAWFKDRVAMTKADFERLSAEAKRKAFTVANVAQLDVVQQVWDAIDRAVKSGTSFADFKNAIGGELRKAWAGSVDDPPWRLETIFRTNLQNAYGAGRYRQAKHPDVASDRPVWMFDAILDGRETPICHACDGTKLPNDDKWWATHTPPLHFNCRSSFIALSSSQAGKITLIAPTAKPDDGFGLPPSEDEWQPSTANVAPPLATALTQKLSATPPAPPQKMQVGVHAQKARAVVGVPKTAPQDFLDSIQDAELLQYLAKYPLSDVVARGSIRGAYGQYVYGPPGLHRVEISWKVAASGFGRPFVPGSTWGVSVAASTVEQARAITFRHELAHHIHLHDRRVGKVDQIIRDAYARARGSKTFITRYAMTNRDEYFAESFAAYYHRRTDLKSHDPNGFQMVEDVLRERGILP